MGVHGLESLCDFPVNAEHERKNELEIFFLEKEEESLLGEGDVLSFCERTLRQEAYISGFQYISEQKYHKVSG